jgi:hypothetical protein
MINFVHSIYSVFNPDIDIEEEIFLNKNSSIVIEIQTESNLNSAKEATCQSPKGSVKTEFLPNSNIEHKSSFVISNNQMSLDNTLSNKNPELKHPPLRKVLSDENLFGWIKEGVLGFNTPLSKIFHQ